LKVLLVYPEYPNTFWSYKHILSFVGRKATFPPLGLLTVAAMLPPDWEKRLVDANTRCLTDEDLGWADMVFIGAMIVQKESAKAIIARAKAAGKTVVAGGPVFTTQPEQFEGVDHFVLDEAEVTLPPFLADLERGEAKPLYTSNMRPDIAKSPMPLWSLIRIKDYVAMAVQFSRGCPFECEFCDIVIMNGRAPRTKTPEQLLAELDALYERGWRGQLFIVDDNFIGNKVAVKRLLPKLAAWQKAHRYPFILMTEASVNLADDEQLMSMMSAANFNKVFLGIETPNVQSLHECGKVQNASRDMAASVETIQAHGMQVMGGFIVGFDHDSDDIFDAQIQFIRQVGIVVAMVVVLTALPKTRLWRRLQAENRLLGESEGGSTSGHLNFVPSIDREVLIAGYRRILSTLYSRREYYARIHTLLGRYRHTARARVSWADMRALFQSFVRIGLLSKSRFLYWRLLLSTLFTCRRALPLAVELAISGQHFERIAAAVRA
jgi:radical SAM superfamily enzyme YgiQ (UPF0313 family)